MVFLASITLHTLAALFWLGGMIFLALVGAPVLRQIEPASLRARIFDDLGTRFRTAGWIAVGILVVTGLVNLHYHGVLAWSVLSQARFWRTRFGTALAVKLVAVSVMLALQAVHDFLHGPQASRAEPGSPEAARLRRRAAMFARVNAVVGLVLVIAAVRLPRS
jgi:copper resistance protein D